MGKVTGIGGIFFKCNDPAKQREWYSKNLGLITDQYGALFEWRQADDKEKPGYTQWSPFKGDTDYFAPSDKPYMVNYRVEGIEELIETLRNNGVTIAGEIQSFEYGKFAHIMDPEGNKIELWEPVDAVFTKMYEGKTTK